MRQMFADILDEGTKAKRANFSAQIGVNPPARCPAIFVRGEALRQRP
jgi:hypothetical protein